MLFSSVIFIFFFLPIVTFLYFVVLKNRIPRNMLLMFASLFFYAWGEPWFVLVMIISIIGNYIFGILVDRLKQSGKSARPVVILMWVFNIGILFVFKYLMFVLHNVNSIFHTRIDVPTIILPIGISFFTFHSISYVLDIYRGKVKVQKDLFAVALYISLFSQLVAGPIIRYETIANQLFHRKETFDDFASGVCRFIVGLAKKVLLANTMAWIADKAFATHANELSVSFAWLGAIAYAFQIYFDFSGYSDMAIGLGRMFGFHFNENFNFPYIARSVTDFWRRWHISLSSWFRDYVYFPMGGSRVSSKYRLVLNLFVVWMLTGIWHGANWTFVAWGFFYFVLLTFEKLTGYAEWAKQTKPHAVLNHILLIVTVLIGWVFFRSVDITHAFAYLQTMFGISGHALIDPYTVFALRDNAVFLIACLIFSMPVHIPLFQDRKSLPIFKTAFASMLYLALLSISIVYLIKGIYNPFIYFNF